MVILFVIDYFTSKTDGTNISATRFREQLIAQGHEVRILGVGVSGAGMYPLKEHKVPIVSRVAKKSGQLFAKFDKRVVTEALRGADLVHFFFPWQVHRKTLKLAKKMGIATTAAFHVQPENVTYNIGLKYFNFVANFIYFLFRKWLYGKVDNIHCPSKFIADELRHHNYQAKLSIISNGVDESFINAANNHKSNDQEVINILMIGRISAEKRQDLIIKAVAKSKYKDRIQLFFAGKGPKLKQYTKLGHMLPRPPKFIFLSQDQLIKQLADIYLYVHASDIEIEGIACIEAFAAGVVPLIANSKKSATPQFSLDERCLFKQRDINDLKNKIEYFIEHPEIKEELSKKYIEYGKLYNVKQCGLKAIEFYREAYNENKIEQAIRKDKKLKKYIKRAKITKTPATLLKILFYYLIVVPVLFVVNKVYLGIKIEGKHHLNGIKKTGGITICNHIHELDSTLCALACFPRRLLFTSLASNLKFSLIGVLVRILGGIAIPDTPLQTRAFFYALSAAARCRRIIHFFPEGHLIRYCEELRSFHRGAFFLSVDSGLPVVPMRIVYRKANAFLRFFGKKRPCMTLKISKPIRPNHLLTKKEATKELQEKVVSIMKDIKNNEYNK